MALSEFNDSQCEVVRAEILHFLAAYVPIMRLNTNGNNLIVFVCNRVRLFCSRSLSDILFYIRSISVRFVLSARICSRREVAEGLFDSAQCIVRLICRMTDRICFFITILNIRNATVEQILIFWHYADFIFPQSTKFIRRTSILMTPCYDINSI